MTSRERVQTALGHRAPDRIPVDFGATAVTGMHVSCVAALRAHYGLAPGPVKVWEPYQMLGLAEPDLLDALGVDVAGIHPRMTKFGFPLGAWKPFRLPWGQDVLVPGGFVTSRDANGDLLIHPQGDAAAPPRGRMPAGGFFVDSIPYQEPIDEARLDPADNLAEFQPLSDDTLAYFRREADRLAGSGRAVVFVPGGTAFGDISQVPMPSVARPRGIRDVTEWYVSLLTRPDYVHRVFAGQCEIALANLARAHAVLGDRVDVVYVCGTDFGTQTSLFCSPESFDELFAPYYRRLNDWVHRHTTWKTFKHSCGAVGPLIGRFIDVGFDILNPVQCSAAGMDPRTLKERYGDRIVFWGGGVDTQRTLPFGTPDEVRREVRERCRVFGAGGGFVFNAVHNVQARTPVANIVAMFEALRECDGR